MEEKRRGIYCEIEITEVEFEPISWVQARFSHLLK